MRWLEALLGSLTRALDSLFREGTGRECPARGTSVGAACLEAATRTATGRPDRTTVCEELHTRVVCGTTVFRMQETVICQVTCPECGSRTGVSVPGDDVEARVSHSVAAFGDQTSVTCSNGHTYWVQFCEH